MGGGSVIYMLSLPLPLPLNFQLDSLIERACHLLCLPPLASFLAFSLISVLYPLTDHSWTIFHTHVFAHRQILL